MNHIIIRSDRGHHIYPGSLGTLSEAAAQFVQTYHMTDAEREQAQSQNVTWQVTPHPGIVLKNDYWPYNATCVPAQRRTDAQAVYAIAVRFLNDTYLPEAGPYESGPIPRSETAIERLKSDWLKDPTWPIEAVEGYEHHAQALQTWREQQQHEQFEHAQRVAERVRSSLTRQGVSVERADMTARIVQRQRLTLYRHAALGERALHMGLNEQQQEQFFRYVTEMACSLIGEAHKEALRTVPVSSGRG